jgi:hypothetical protein
MSPLWPTAALTGLVVLGVVWMWRGHQQTATVTRVYASHNVDYRMFPKTPDGGAGTGTPDTYAAPPSGHHSADAVRPTTRTVLIVADGPNQQEPRIAC